VFIGRFELWESEAMLFSVQVEVSPRQGIADPQGATIERSLPTLGFPGVRGVRVGKSIRFSLDSADEASARAEVEDMCARFLTNPVIEDSVVHIEAVSAATS
jgi:phosphoribosylformylglycinamidine synthase PurS subunit